jgi:uncharacterized protein (TIGR02147 family)
MELATEATAAPPNIFNYNCHRKFLCDFFASKKAMRSSFSHRRFATMAGFKSPNYLLLVMQGKRNLSNEAADGVANAMGLRGAERRIFLALVHLANAQSPEESALAEKERLVGIKHLVTKMIPSWHVEVHSRWYHPLVRELVFLPGFEPSGEYISKKLKGAITPEQAWDSFVLLQKAGYIAQRLDGTYTPLNPVVDTGDFVFQRGVMDRHHRETLEMWSKNIEKLTPEHQERGLVNIPIPASKIPELRERMRRFQDEIIGWLQDEPSADSLVQLGVYLMPIEVGKASN